MRSRRQGAAAVCPSRLYQGIDSARPRIKKNSNLLKISILLVSSGLSESALKMLMPPGRGCGHVPLEFAQRACHLLAILCRCEKKGFCVGAKKKRCCAGAKKMRFLVGDFASRRHTIALASSRRGSEPCASARGPAHGEAFGEPTASRTARRGVDRAGESTGKSQPDTSQARGRRAGTRGRPRL